MEYGLYILTVGALIVGVLLYRSCWMIRKPANIPYGFGTLKVGDDGIKRYTCFYCERPSPIHEYPPRNYGAPSR